MFVVLKEIRIPAKYRTSEEPASLLAGLFLYPVFYWKTRVGEIDRRYYIGNQVVISSINNSGAVRHLLPALPYGIA